MAEFLTSTDEFMWSLGEDPVLRSTIVSLMILERAPEWDLVVERFERLTRVAPRFRQVVSPTVPPLPARWEEHAEFDLDWHLHRVSAPQPRTFPVLVNLAEVAMMTDLDRTRPLWEVTLVEGMADGSAALLCKFDHALTDGVGAVALAAALYDELEVLAASEGSKRPSGSVAAQVLETIRHPLTTAATAFDTAVSIYRAARPIAGPLSPVMRRRSATRRLEILEVSRSGLRGAGDAAGGTVNDAFLAAVTGGLRRYHDHHGVTVDQLMTSMPISVRGPHDGIGGNRATLVRFDVPVGEVDPMRRIREIHARTMAARGEKALAYTQLIAKALNVMPRGYVGSELRHVDFIASDVPGSPVPLKMGGAPIRSQYAFSPTLGAAVNTTSLSYVDVCAIGVNIDAGAIPDHDVLRDCLTAGFEETLSVHAAGGGPNPTTGGARPRRPHGAPRRPRRG